jgi:hypothetical protein
MNKMDGIKTILGNFFKLHDLERNGLSLGSIKNGSLNHVPQRAKGNNILMGRRNNFFGGTTSRMFDKKI